MLNQQEITDISRYLEGWKPTHTIVLNLRPKLDASPKRLAALMTNTLHRIERRCYGRRTRKVAAVAWAEVGRKEGRLHLHIIARLPPPLRQPLDAQVIEQAWRAAAGNIAADKGATYFAPITDPLAAWIYNQKGGGDMIAYTNKKTA